VVRLVELLPVQELALLPAVQAQDSRASAAPPLAALAERALALVAVLAYRQSAVQGRWALLPHHPWALRQVVRALVRACRLWAPLGAPLDSHRGD